MEKKSDRREYNRFHLEFVMEINAKDPNGNEFTEKTTSKDVSGGGTNFITHMPERYYPGQILQMTFYLPGTKKVNARMKANGQTVRIDPIVISGNGRKKKEASVAVRFNSLLNFERIHEKDHEKTS